MKNTLLLIVFILTITTVYAQRIGSTPEHVKVLHHDGGRAVC